MKLETKRDETLMQGRRREKRRERWSSGEETDGVTKQRVIVSNWDNSQSVTSENSQSYPLVSPLSSVTCLFSLTPSARGTRTHTNTHNTHAHRRCRSQLFASCSVYHVHSLPLSYFPLCCIHRHKNADTRGHNDAHAPVPRGRTVCLSQDRGEL